MHEDDARRSGATRIRLDGRLLGAPEILALASAGDVDGALALARRYEVVNACARDGAFADALSCILVAKGVAETKAPGALPWNELLNELSLYAGPAGVGWADTARPSQEEARSAVREWLRAQSTSAMATRLLAFGSVSDEVVRYAPLDAFLLSATRAPALAAREDLDEQIAEFLLDESVEFLAEAANSRDLFLSGTPYGHVALVQSLLARGYRLGGERLARLCRAASAGDRRTAAAYEMAGVVRELTAWALPEVSPEMEDEVVEPLREFPHAVAAGIQRGGIRPEILRRVASWKKPAITAALARSAASYALPEVQALLLESRSPGVLREVAVHGDAASRRRALLRLVRLAPGPALPLLEAASSELGITATDLGSVFRTEADPRLRARYFALLSRLPSEPESSRTPPRRRGRRAN
jgi:hypothetical protein